jgi:hypothetical protein
VDQQEITVTWGKKPDIKGIMAPEGALGFYEDLQPLGGFT